MHMGMSVALHAANEYCRWSVLPYFEVRGGVGLASVDGAVRCGHNPRCRCSSRGARARARGVEFVRYPGAGRVSLET